MRGWSRRRGSRSSPALRGALRRARAATGGRPYGSFTALRAVRSLAEGAAVGAVAPALAGDDALALGGLVAAEEADLADSLLVAAADAELHVGVLGAARSRVRGASPAKVGTAA